MLESQVTCVAPVGDRCGEGWSGCTRSRRSTGSTCCATSSTGWIVRALRCAPGTSTNRWWRSRRPVTRAACSSP
jgi:hypothetical protein